MTDSSFIGTGTDLLAGGGKAITDLGIWGLENLLFKGPAIGAMGERADAMTSYLQPLTEQRGEAGAAAWDEYRSGPTGAQAKWNRTMEEARTPWAARGGDVDLEGGMMYGDEALFPDKTNVDWRDIDPYVKASLQAGARARTAGAAAIAGAETGKVEALASLETNTQASLDMFTNAAAGELAQLAGKFEMASNDPLRYQRDLESGGKIFADKQRDIREAGARAGMQRLGMDLNAKYNNAKAGILQDRTRIEAGLAQSYDTLIANTRVADVSKVLEADFGTVQAFIESQRGSRADNQLALDVGIADAIDSRQGYTDRMLEINTMFGANIDWYMRQDQYRITGISAAMGLEGPRGVFDPMWQGIQSGGNRIAQGMANKEARDDADSGGMS